VGTIFSDFRVLSDRTLTKRFTNSYLEILMNSIGRKTLIACAVATALGSGAALALDPSVTPDAVLYAAGGSAQANAFSVAANLILDNQDSYSDSTSACSVLRIAPSPLTAQHSLPVPNF
jgi:hypothetical protein